MFNVTFSGKQSISCLGHLKETSKKILNFMLNYLFVLQGRYGQKIERN